MGGKRKNRIVIIGNSAAGTSALISIRKKDKDSKILLIDKKPYPFYSRVLLPYFIMDERMKMYYFYGTIQYIKNLMLKSFASIGNIGSEMVSETLIKKRKKEISTKSFVSIRKGD